MKKYFTLAFIFVLGTSISIAQTNSGLQFLNIGPNAHSLSLSEAHTAVALGSASLFTNPANLMLNTQSNIGISYTLWIQETQNTQASALFLREKDAFSVGFLSSLIDGIEGRNTPGPSGSDLSVTYLALTGGYARQFGPLSVGVSGSYLYEQIVQQNASGFGFSAGATATLFSDRLRLGTALTNAGRMGELINERSELPTLWRIGFDADAIQLSAFSGQEIPVLVRFSADFVMPVDENLGENSENLLESGNYFAFGLDANLYDMITIRGGYRTGNTSRSWSLGAGIDVQPIKFQYAFIPFETGFGSVHSISLQYFFDF